MKPERFGSLKDELAGDLAAASRAYLTGAFERFHADREPGHPEAQALIGNLVIGIELTLKAFLAARNPSLVFKELPLEARALLEAPADVPKDLDWKRHELDLRDFMHATLSFEEAARAFHIFLPGKKQSLRPYFRLAADLKDLSLRASLGRVERSELERVVYAALETAEAAASYEGRTSWRGYAPTETDRTFLQNYADARSRSVTDKLDVARRKAKTLKVDITFNDPGQREGWDAFDTRCPVCQNWGTLSGSTEALYGAGDHRSLEFRADTFECDSCGLLFEDAEELALARMSLAYDRTEDLAKWQDEHGE